MVCYVVYFGSICRSPNSVPFFSFSFGRSWCEIGMLASFVRSVVASLAKKSAFSFPSIPWCDPGNYYLFMVVGKFGVCFLNHLYDFVLFGDIGVCYRVYRSQGV